MGTYMGDMYQIYYLNGLIAGALTESNKIGYVAAFPIPELFRHMNAFASGYQGSEPRSHRGRPLDLRLVRPRQVAREAAEALDMPTAVDVLGLHRGYPLQLSKWPRSITEKGEARLRVQPLQPHAEYTARTPYPHRSADRLGHPLRESSFRITRLVIPMRIFPTTTCPLSSEGERRRSGCFLGPTRSTPNSYVQALKGIMVESDKDFGKYLRLRLWS